MSRPEMSIGRIASDEEGYPMTRKRILMVDDDAEIGALCARWLGKVTRSL